MPKKETNSVAEKNFTIIECPTPKTKGVKIGHARLVENPCFKKRPELRKLNGKPVLVDLTTVKPVKIGNELFLFVNIRPIQSLDKDSIVQINSNFLCEMDEATSGFIEKSKFTANIYSQK